jgi:hypothetical protein
LDRSEGKSVYGYNILIEKRHHNIGKNNFVKDTKAEIPYSKDNFSSLFVVDALDIQFTGFPIPPS